jgi:transcriptional regulator with XRE-family HTH domain
MQSKQSERLKQARERRGLSQADLAKLLNKPQSTVGRMEGNKPMRPRVDLAIQVARELHSTVEYLFGDGDEANELFGMARRLQEMTAGRTAA